MLKKELIAKYKSLIKHYKKHEKMYQEMSNDLKLIQEAYLKVLKTVNTLSDVLKEIHDFYPYVITECTEIDLNELFQEHNNQIKKLINETKEKGEK